MSTDTAVAERPRPDCLDQLFGKKGFGHEHFSAAELATAIASVAMMIDYDHLRGFAPLEQAFNHVIGRVRYYVSNVHVDDFPTRIKEVLPPSLQARDRKKTGFLCDWDLRVKVFDRQQPLPPPAPYPYGFKLIPYEEWMKQIRAGKPRSSVHGQFKKSSFLCCNRTMLWADTYWRVYAEGADNEPCWFELAVLPNEIKQVCLVDTHAMADLIGAEGKEVAYAILHGLHRVLESSNTTIRHELIQNEGAQHHAGSILQRLQ